MQGRHLAWLKGGSKSEQVLCNGIEAVMMLTSTILNTASLAMLKETVSNISMYSGDIAVQWLFQATRTLRRSSFFGFSRNVLAETPTTKPEKKLHR